MKAKRQLAERISALLEGKNKTEIAAKFNVSRQTVYDWCRLGSINEDHLLKLCEMYKVDPVEMKYGEAYKTLSIDLRLMTSIITALENAIRQHCLEFSPEDYAATISSIYDIYKGETDVTEKTISLAIETMMTKIPS